MKNTRHRYIAFEIRGSQETHYSRRTLLEAMMGSLRMSPRQPAGLRFQLIQYDPASSRGIARVVPHTATEWMKNFILSLGEQLGKGTTARILGTSGTLKATRRNYLSRLGENQEK